MHVRRIGVCVFIGAAFASTEGAALAADPPAAEPAPAPAPAAATAEPASTKKMTFGVDAAFALPISTLADVAGVGFGALVKFQYKVADPFSFTARAGFIYHVSKKQGGFSFGISEIPILVGGKYYFMGGNTGLYGAAEVGLFDIMSRADVPTGGGNTTSASSSSTKFGLTVGAGFELGALDFRAQLVSLDVGHFGDAMMVMANVGYNFFAF